MMNSKEFFFQRPSAGEEDEFPDLPYWKGKTRWPSAVVFVVTVSTFR